MSVVDGVIVATVAVAAFTTGRLSARQAVRNLREALDWHDRLSTFERIDRPRH